MIRIILLVVVFITFLTPEDAFSQAKSNIPVLDKIQNLVAAHGKLWVVLIKQYALNIFLALATINLIIRMFMFMLDGGNDIYKILGYLVRYLFVTSIFYMLLQNGVEYAQLIVNGFMQLGQKGLGVSSAQAGVDEIINLAYLVIESSCKNLSAWDPAGAIITIIIGLITFVVLFLIVANYIVEIFSAWVLIYAGYFVLALGGTEWTRESAIAYFKAVVAVGLRIMTIMFMMGIAMQIIREQVSALGIKEGSVELQILSAVALLGTALLLLFLITKLPDAVANLVSSAWGNMGAINMAAGLSVLRQSMSMINKSYESGSSALSNFKAGANDHVENKKNKDDPNFKAQKSGSGLAYHAGRAAAYANEKTLSSTTGNPQNNRNMSEPKGLFSKQNKQTDNDKKEKESK